MAQLRSLRFNRHVKELFARALAERSGSAHVSDMFARFVDFADAQDMIKRCNDIPDPSAARRPHR